MTTQLRTVATTDPDTGLSLPAWTYRDPEFFAAEQAAVLRPAWQIVCHQSDIAGVGEWHSLEFLGENIIAVRGDDRVVRAFTNVCRHRGSRLVDGNRGCAKKLVCPYHAWTYGLDGRLIGLPGRSEYVGLRLEDHGLSPVELEIWQGFVFVRLEGGGPSVATMMAE
jgi:phenylpropionate dioxygenase-like ring-hydroxylating dioxygenase large terminal subunit